MRRLLQSPAPPDRVGGILVRPSTRARRLSLTVDARTGEVVLVFPRRASVKKAELFVHAQQDWIAARRRETASRTKIEPGMTIEILGVPHTVDHTPGRGLARIADGRVTVRGDIALFEKRLIRALKAHAEEVLTQAAQAKAARLTLPRREIRLRDPKTRWGSCGPDGRIMLSWRLILAPPRVMDYVIAHETAHRVHMNHGRKFWALCASLSDEAGTSRRWLKRHGSELMQLI